MKTKSKILGRALFIAVTVSVSQLSVADQLPVVSAQCRDIQKQLDAPSANNFERYMLESSIPLGGVVGDARYFNIDVDEDGINDVIVSSCSSSNTPSDPCVLSIELSTGGKIEFFETRFYLARYHGKIYVIANHIGPNVNIGKRKAYLMDVTGIHLVCNSL